MTLTRRALVGSLLALTACPHVVVDTSPAGGPVVLGWRLVPGMEVAWRTVVTRRVGATVTRRAEEWTYRVVRLDDDGGATLDGELTGFGAGIDIDGTPLPDGAVAAARTAEQERVRAVSLRLALDGRLLACSARSFPESLPHQALALTLPGRPVAPHDDWPDPGVARPFADLLPLDLEVLVEGTGRLLEVHTDRGHPLAALEATGSARAPDGPRIVVRGQAEFDLAAGLLRRHTLEARFEPTPRDPSLDPGVLTVESFAV